MKKSLTFKQLAILTIGAEVASKLLFFINPILGSGIFWLAIIFFFMAIVNFLKEKRARVKVSGLWFIVWLVSSLFLAGIPTPS